ncbi:hypothetical protein [uncultured Pseudacidovorax sp.]|uniref:hypothetical protein n=1 Tax=uncultured Pseudacidovorax sp. TaxID=679313 RepID=UPI0025D082A9|nr:hypothetical protein [uncultured Pseudacidovorax sp.]
MIWNFERLQMEVNRIASGRAKEREKIQQLVDLFYGVIARSIPVDPEFYLRTYKDISEAIQSGAVSSASEHFINHGFYEGRLPMEPKIDEQLYCQKYPDIGEAIVDGRIESGADHWASFGRLEGREVNLLVENHRA